MKKNSTATLVRPLHLNGAETKTRLKFTKVSDIEETEIKWLWKGEIPLGKLTLIAGESGVGKTSLLCAISAVVSRGGYFPGTKEPCKQGRVIFLTGEDGISDTIKSRLRLSGANESRVEILEEMVEDEYFNVHKHLKELEAEMTKMGDASLLIIDPITSFMGTSSDTNQVGVVRPVLSRLKTMAERTGASVMILNHLGKNQNASLSNRVLGSQAWVAAPRATLVAMRHPEHGHVLGKVNANNASEKGVYPYSLTNKEGDDPEKYYAEFSDNTLPDLKMDDLTDYDISSGHRNKMGEACNIIEEMLASGSREKDEIIKACDKQDISKHTVVKAFKQLGGTSELTKNSPPKAVWRLPF